jgi:hypothetical protein
MKCRWQPWIDVSKRQTIVETGRWRGPIIKLHGMDDMQREKMCAARKWVDGGFTHQSDEVTRPREWL